MKKGLLLRTPAGWCVAAKKSFSEVESYPVSLDLIKSTVLKHNTPVIFETTKSNIVIDMKKYTPAKSYRKHDLSTKPGGSTLKFIFAGKVQTRERIKYPTAYVNKVLKEIENEPDFLMEIYENGELIWEAGEFIFA